MGRCISRHLFLFSGLGPPCHREKRAWEQIKILFRPPFEVVPLSGQGAPIFVRAPTKLVLYVHTGAGLVPAPRELYGKQTVVARMGPHVPFAPTLFGN